MQFILSEFQLPYGKRAFHDGAICDDDVYDGDVCDGDVITLLDSSDDGDVHDGGSDKLDYRLLRIHHSLH